MFKDKEILEVLKKIDIKLNIIANLLKAKAIKKDKE